MPIVVFDIDGTLTDTMDVDVECYEAAIREELGVEIPSDWPTFPEVTDASILATACERRGMTIPGPEVLERIAERVGELLAEALALAPGRFREIAGAREVFGFLQRAGWKVAMATGAWRPSALLKLEGAGIPYAGVPLATASDHPTRAEIIREAVRAHARGDGEDVVYVGDGVWDGRAARTLGYVFVGIGSGERSAALHDAGADSVVRDYTDQGAFLERLERAVGRRG